MRLMWLLPRSLRRYLRKRAIAKMLREFDGDGWVSEKGLR